MNVVFDRYRLHEQIGAGAAGVVRQTTDELPYHIATPGRARRELDTRQVSGARNVAGVEFTTRRSRILMHVYGFRGLRCRGRPGAQLRVIVASTSLGGAREALGRAGFDKPRRHFRVDDREAARLALRNPDTVIWQTLDAWAAGDRSWQVGGTETVEGGQRQPPDQP
ncbi:MAG: hypothetical protein ACRDSR_25560 [Pseudonocardiaceae bacterium]